MQRVYVHLTLDINRTSQEKRVFNHVHSEQKEGW